MKVKPLRWGKIESTESDREWHFAGFVDTYLVCKGDDDCTLAIANQSLGTFPNLEAAKAAAEADWQQRGSELLAKIAEPSDDRHVQDEFRSDADPAQLGAHFGEVLERMAEPILQAYWEHFPAPIEIDMQDADAATRHVRAILSAMNDRESGR